MAFGSIDIQCEKESQPVEDNADAYQRLLANLKQRDRSRSDKTKPSVCDRSPEQHKRDASETAVVVEMIRHLDGKCTKSVASVVRLSNTMAKLSVPVPPKFSEVVELRFSCQAINLELNIESRVNWIRPGDDDAWIVTCSFLSVLSGDVLSALHASGHVDCRREPRRKVHVPATAHWPLEREPMPVVISDYSEGGFCLTTERPETLHDKVLLTLSSQDDSASVIGFVRWHTESQHENQIGCEFASADGYRSLDEAVQRYLQNC